MKIEDINKLKNQVGIILGDNRDKIGTIEMKKLVNIYENIRDLISYLENPEKYLKKKDKINKSLNLGVEDEIMLNKFKRKTGEDGRNI